jgi:hypothetical protein
MGEYFSSAPINLEGQSELIAGQQLESSGIALESDSSFESGESVPTLVAGSDFVVEGLQVVEHKAGYHHVARYVGEPNVPKDVRRLRRSVYELMRRMGTPVLVKKMLTEEDVHEGTATTSPNFDDIYGQTRNRDPLSHGIGYVSVENSTDEWINTTTSEIVHSDTGVEAPRYRGYGPGFLTYIIEPDAAVDFFKHTPEGVLIKVQTATAQAPWWPDIDDNDLIIHVELDRAGYIIGTGERYQSKMTNPVSIRGAKERRGRHEYSGDFGSRYVVNQTFEMALLPKFHELYGVEVDR